jgi:cobalt-zinc-cadmium resistance protein CzcA
VRKLLALYSRVLDGALAHERALTIAALVLLAIAALLYTQVGKTFMPSMDEGDIILQLEKLPSISLEESVEIDLRVQRAILARVPEVVGVFARTGSDELGLDPMGLNQTDSFLVLKPRDEWRQSSKEALVDDIRGVLDDFPGIGYAFTQPIEMRVSEMLTGVRGDLAIKVFGADQAELGRLAEQISALVGEIDGAQDVYTPRNEGAQYYRIELDRMALGRLGLSVDAVAEAMRSMVEGSQAGVVYQGARRIPIVLRGPEAIRESPALFAGMEVTVPSGEVVPLASLARIDRVEGPVAIQREKGNRMAVVIANVTGRDLVGFVDEAREAVARGVNLPVGYFLEWGGQFENQQRAAKRLGLVVPVAIGLIFLILFSTFRSVSQAVLILANVPFAMIGGIAALWLTREYLSVPASVGFIALLGIAVLNGVVMVSYFNQLRAMGRPIAEVVVEGAKRRLRPVMMTATIAAFGLVPLLFATGPGSEIQKPLAIVVIGGLISSTALTLVLLPILYRRFLGGRPN